MQILTLLFLALLPTQRIFSASDGATVTVGNAEVKNVRGTQVSCSLCVGGGKQ